MASETLVPFAAATESVAIVERRTSGGTMALAISGRDGAVAKSVVRAVLLATYLCFVTHNNTMLLLLSKVMGLPRDMMGGECWWVRCWYI